MKSSRVGVLSLCGLLGVLVTGALGCGSSASTSRDGNGGSAQGGGAGASPTGGGGSTSSGGTSSGGDTSSGGNTSGGGSAGGSAGQAGQPMTPEAVCRAAVEAQCEVKLRCGIYAERTDCTAFADLCPEYYFNPNSTRTVESVLACLPTILNRSCQEERASLIIECLSPGTLADGAPCTYGSECVSTTCYADVGCETCQHRPGPGEACDTTCAQGNLCDGTTMQCVAVVTEPPAAEGEPCNTTGSPFIGCQGVLGCSPTGASSTPTCHVLPGRDEPCPEGTCQPNLFCTGTSPICTPNTAACSPTCPITSGCVEVDGAHTCVPYATEGDACDGAVLCAPDLMCKNATCAVRPRRGEPCEEGDCSRELVCTNGVCSDPDPVPCE